MRLPVLLLLSQFLLAGMAHGAARHHEVQVADPYLELHTGPHRGYPVVQIADRGEWVSILKRRTDWFKVRTERGYEGWVKRSQMERTLQPSGEELAFYDPQLGDFAERRWEMGVLGGDFDGASSISAYGAFAISPNLSVELWTSQALGTFSNSYLAHINIVHQFVPEWRVSPFFTLGTGVIRTEPKATLVQAEDRSDQIGHVGIGVRSYVTRRFIFRAEYKSYVVFTSRDDNEEVDEWKAGFSFFF